MDEWSGKTIFVHIPAYRDSELVPTLIDLIDRAAHPVRLHVSVCWQHAQDESLPLAGDTFVPLAASTWFGRWLHQVGRRGARIDVADYTIDDARGCGWARAMAQARYDSEDYVLQLDAHHRFVDGWDVQLVAMLESLRPRSARPVLVGYPPAYRPDGMRHETASGVRIDFAGFGGPKWLKVSSSLFSATAPIRARFFSGGFAFADGRFVRDVPADPSHYFLTEELASAMRAYTHGYDLFHPHRHVLWHFYTREEAAKVWDDRPQDAARREYRAQASLAALMAPPGIAGDSEGPPTGTCRTIEAFERYSGLCFSRRAASPEVLARQEPSDADQALSRAEWLARLATVP